jgi:hypothetical protein
MHDFVSMVFDWGSPSKMSGIYAAFRAAAAAMSCLVFFCWWAAVDKLTDKAVRVLSIAVDDYDPIPFTGFGEWP